MTVTKATQMLTETDRVRSLEEWSDYSDLIRRIQKYRPDDESNSPELLANRHSSRFLHSLIMFSKYNKF